MLDEAKLATTLAYIGQLLVNGKYEGVEALTGGRRLTGAQIESAIKTYGRTLVLPPGGRFAARSVVDIQQTEPQRWSVYVDLWTAEEGRSDLTLELTVSDSSEPLYGVEIDDLHTL